MHLYDLLENGIKTALPDMEISGVTDDSRKVGKDTLFVCVKGEKFDGHDFAARAIDEGAAAVVTEHDLGIEKQIIVQNSRKTYGDLCASWFNHPERKIKLIGVTGTNGKTTVTTLIKDILIESGHRPGLIGTIQNEINGKPIHTDKTTPLTYDYMKILADMVAVGCDCAVMEVSSFALVQERLGPSHFRVAVFTNLTQDHLDYHADMEDYYKAKRLLFERCDKAIINIDDEYGKRLYSEVKCDKMSCSVKGEASFYAEDISVKADGINYLLHAGRETMPLSLSMTGEFNVINSLQAAAVCNEIAIPQEIIGLSLSKTHGVKGRCEIIPTNSDFTVICDYAHTPDAIENILSSLKPFTKGKLVCLFGCGGDRDKAKRPKMAAAASKYADKLIVTSDNPRSEKPSDIIDEIVKGIENVAYERIDNRYDAIEFALKNADKGDIIVLAGKGHEDYQELAGKNKIHFDEREVVAEIMTKL